MSELPRLVRAGFMYSTSQYVTHFSAAALSSITRSPSVTSRPLSFSISLRTSTELTFRPSAKYARKRRSCSSCCFPLLWAKSSRRWAFFVGMAKRLMVKVSPYRRMHLYGGRRAKMRLYGGASFNCSHIPKLHIWILTHGNGWNKEGGTNEPI